MRVQKITIVTVQVRDFAAMVAWYEETLGLSRGWFEAD